MELNQPRSELLPIPPEVSAALAASVRRLRHDLGKSMSLQLRFAGADADAEILADALRDDVLQTRRGPRGTRSAFELFDGAWPWLVGEAELPEPPGGRVDLSRDPVLMRLAEAIAELRSHRSEIEARSLSQPALTRLVALAHEGTAACKELVVRYGDAAGSGRG